MNKILRTDAGLEILGKVVPLLREALSAFNKLEFKDGQSKILTLKCSFNIEPSNYADGSAEYLDDLWVVCRYIDLIAAYGSTWEKIVNGQFSDSWSSLQDCIDFIRLVKKFSNINTSFFEEQLTQLEKAYPYRIFMSIGATVSYFKCSICGENIESDKCTHLMGELYSGVMACGVAQDLIDFDHVAMVTHPEDKRCVIIYPDESEEFKLLRHLSTYIETNKFALLEFSHLEYSKRFQVNTNHRVLQRNEACYCGSTKKFKKCCINNSHIENDHVDFVARRRSITDMHPRSALQMSV